MATKVAKPLVSILLSFASGILLESYFPGLGMMPVLLLCGALCVALFFLIKITDERSNRSAALYAAMMCGFMSLGINTLASKRAGEIEAICNEENGRKGTMVAHIQSQVEMKNGGVECVADVYYMEDSLLTIKDSKSVRSMLKISDSAATNLREGDVIMIPCYSITSTNDNENFLQYSYRRMLKLQGINAICNVNCYVHITHMKGNRLRDAMFAANGYFKNTLKKTKF